MSNDPYNTPYVPNRNQGGPTLYPHIQAPSPSQTSVVQPNYTPQYIPQQPQIPPQQAQTPQQQVQIPLHAPVVAHGQGSIQDAEEGNVNKPLIEKGANGEIHHHYHYPAYHPKHHYYKAKSSRCYCCFWALCCSFCCMLICVGVILGSIIGAFAAQCINASVQDPKVYSFYNTTLIQNINVKIDDGKVSVIPSVSGNLTLTLTRITTQQQFLSDFVETYSFVDGTVSLTETINRGDWMHSIQACSRVSLEVQLPPNFNGSLVIETSNSNIEFENLSNYQIQLLQLKTTNGNIKGQSAFVNSVELSTTNGGIDLNGISGNSLTSSTTNGKIKLQSLNSLSLSATTSNSAIELETIKSSSITLKTSNGGISFDNVQTQDLSATTSNSKISGSSPVVLNSNSTVVLKTSNSQIQVPVSGFAGNFDLSTSNGGITITGNQVTITSNSSNEKKGYVQSASNRGSFTAITTNGNINQNFN